jgi:hypothetical protein
MLENRMTLSLDQAAQKVHGLVPDEGFAGASRNDPAQQLHELLAGTQGLSAGAKRDLFNDLAAKLDGAQLGRLAGALGDRGDALALANAVAMFGTSQAQADFATAIASQSTGHESGIGQIAAAADAASLKEKTFIAANLDAGRRADPKALYGLFEKSPELMAQAMLDREVMSSGGGL